MKKGDAYKQAGDYQAAAREYEKAYALVPHPVLMFNLGQVHRLNGDADLALDYYERYLAVEPDGVGSAQAREFAALLRTEIERKRREKARPAEPAAPPEPPPRKSGAAAARSEGSGLRIAGLATGAAGLVAIAVGVKFGIDARAASDDIDEHDQGPWPDDLLDRQGEGERAERAMIILTAAGAAAVATGGVLYVLGRRAGAERERTAVVSPVAAGDLLGLVVTGHF